MAPAPMAFLFKKFYESSIDSWELSLRGCLEAGAVKDTLGALAKIPLILCCHAGEPSEAAGQPVIA